MIHFKLAKYSPKRRLGKAGLQIAHLEQSATVWKPDRQGRMTDEVATVMIQLFPPDAPKDGNGDPIPSHLMMLSRDFIVQTYDHLMKSEAESRAKIHVRDAANRR